MKPPNCQLCGRSMTHWYPASWLSKKENRLCELCWDTARDQVFAEQEVARFGFDLTLEAPPKSVDPRKRLRRS